ncbi:MAG: general secretion pathway protein GspK [Rhizobiaceae bacterium]|nr:general secretion pathway protein GspK [Rhizobiaceae bacterium]
MTVRGSRDAEGGVVLINVLAIVAIASAVAVTMLTLSQAAIERSQRFNDAAQALATCLGAETSVIIALRRDLEEAPDVDHGREAWAMLAETAAPIAGGTFDLAIADAQSRFNVNGLRDGGSAALENFRSILVSLELPGEWAERAFALIRFTGPVSDIGELQRAGIDAAAIARLSDLVTALPGRTEVNLNTASQNLLAVLLKNPVAAAFLVSRRDRLGYLTKDDLDAADILLAPGVGFTSRYFEVAVDVRVGEAEQTLTSLLYRGERDGRPQVVALSRKRGRAAPSPEPPS